MLIRFGRNEPLNMMHNSSVYLYIGIYVQGLTLKEWGIWKHKDSQ